MEDLKKDFRCRVCGLEQIEKPWGDDGATPSFEICDCCGVEFGYEDSTELSIKRYREDWLRRGGEWFDKKAKPIDWSLDEQIKYVGV
ncbi:hypothetical protein [Cnuella takakiae]|uniref:hypothetical protein n=1 Tax=Cnuella takakiae TaxID=1302690 RepID=UPI00093497C1|nr:hypothetical protein [Cnuella takakiae]OLY94437.1 hypothetical protein BUE76_23060 [Cnuella takakiae]